MALKVLLVVVAVMLVGQVVFFNPNLPSGQSIKNALLLLFGLFLLTFIFTGWPMKNDHDDK